MEVTQECFSVARDAHIILARGIAKSGGIRRIVGGKTKKIIFALTLFGIWETLGDRVRRYFGYI